MVTQLKPNQKISDEELFAAMARNGNSISKAAADLGIEPRGVHRRVARLTAAGHSFPINDPRSGRFIFRKTSGSPRINLSAPNAVIMVASDAHYWPNEISVAHKAFVKLLKALKPDMVIMNGDLFDGATISRHGRIGWEKRPTVKDELAAVGERLAEIDEAKGGAEKWWLMGNHDLRFETFLSTYAGPFEEVSGFTLSDRFPDWNFSMSMFVNDNLMIKHRYRNGVHATWNNALHSGTSMCTGHLHRLQATILSDYRGTRWGVDTGTLSDPNGLHMNYAEDNPKNHCSGFAVLTVKDSMLLQPEFCVVLNDEAYFRGSSVL
jgi:hypothetical protein